MLDEKCLKANIWPETSNQVKDTKDIMGTIQSKKTDYQQTTSGLKTCLLFLFNKEKRYISSLISHYLTIELLNRYEF